ncbi:MAG: aminotransferase class III-fold pyridoxal phosphate-dependent enzyme [Clostridiales bacterium]|jgi:glutamate-1-semialdehyde 2,1-aminomutase|nr:aminotransferase class III-fold pyridoxal phosphate-dependent enzyme [Clostridiales bacterium]
MGFPIYDYPNSGKAFERALKVIPSGIYGHQGPSEGCYIPREAFPYYSSRAKGTRFWDIDSNEYIDYMCGYGPNVLGYCDETVDAAALNQLKKENCVTIPSAIMVDFAELLVDTVACADWAFFAKNGGDVTTLAVMTARAATRRKKIIFFKGYYHGVAPWTQKLDYPGVLEDDVRNNLYVEFNDYPALAEAVSENRGKIAAIIAQPYMHGNFYDNELPAEGFWRDVRALCDKEGIVLIIDDVRAGFRLDLKGSDHYYGFKADLICFCKALANGYNMSALCGAEALKDSVSSISYTGSYWMSAVPFAAGIATINKLKELDAPELFRRLGLRLTNGLKHAADSLGFHLVVSGEPALFYLRLADDDSLMLHQKWIAACVRRGVFFTSHHNHFINAALTEADVDKTIEIAADALEAVKQGKI